MRTAPEPRTPASRWEPRWPLCAGSGGTWAVPGAGGVLCSPQRCVSYSGCLHLTLLCVPQGPAELGRVPGTLSPSLSGISHPYSRLSPERACRLPPRVPRGLRLGVARPLRSCPELLVTSYLLLWGWVCCWAGQREVTRLSLGVPARKPPQDISRILPQPTHFRGHLASPALLGEVGRVAACIEA